jgi:hypothetical protein
MRMRIVLIEQVCAADFCVYTWEGYEVSDLAEKGMGLW